MSTAPFVGYPAQVWGASWQALSWLSAQMAAAPADNAAAAAVLETPVTAVFATLWNGLVALSAWQTGVALSLESQEFFRIQNFPLDLDQTTQTYVQSRASACVAAANGISGLIPSISLFNVATRLASGQPVIADPQFLEWCMQFTGEAAPIDAQLPGSAQDAAVAWLTTANAVGVLQGSDQSPAYDAALRQYRCASVIATVMQQLQSGGFSDVEAISAPVPMTDDQGNVITDDLGNTIYVATSTEGTPTWSTAVSLPTLLLTAAALTSAPSSVAAQQVSVIRYALMSQVLQLAQLLLSFRSKTVDQPSTAYLRNAESLMDFAARTTGDFANWSNIAALNGIGPPYPGMSNPAQALQGKALFIAGTPNTGTTQATYAANVLGIDLDLGPINGAQPAWLGDFSLITGYANFARAIGRRLQTPLGALVFHNRYGCSIPAEIGSVQTADESARLTEYARSAIRGDPRLGSIMSASTVVAPGFQAHVQIALTSIGAGASAVRVSEVIGANPR